VLSPGPAQGRRLPSTFASSELGNRTVKTFAYISEYMRRATGASAESCRKRLIRGLGLAGL